MKITMKDYLEQTQYICESLIKLIKKIEDDKIDIAPVKELINIYEKKAETLAQKADEKRKTDKPSSLNTILEAAGYGIAAKKNREQINNAEKIYNNALFDVNGPIQSVSQALLQIAKQGISLTYGKNKKWECKSEFTLKGNSLPKIYNVSILDIIWEGRNQSIHFENADELFDNVTYCFDNLIKNVPYDVMVSLINYKNGENKAYEIIKILNWTEYEKFKTDMMSLSIN